MSSLLTEIKKMTLEEKLQTMELLWSELQENSDNVAFPDWHRDILDQREKMESKCSGQYSDWNEAKNDIEKIVK